MNTQTARSTEKVNLHPRTSFKTNRIMSGRERLGKPFISKVISEQMNRRNFQKHEEFLDNLADIIFFSLDRNYCYTSFSKLHKATMKAIWGVDILAGMNMLEAITSLEDREKAKNNFDRALHGEHFSISEEYGDSKLIRTYYEDFYNPVKDENGRIVGISVFVIDITGRIQSLLKQEKNEKALNAIIRVMPDLIFVIDKDGNYLDVYCSEPELLVVPIDRIVGTNLRNIFDANSAELHLQNITRCIVEKKLITYEYLIDNQGDVDHYEARIVPLGDDSVLTLVRKITERKVAEMHIRDLNANLERKVAARTAELASVNSNLMSEIEGRKLAEENLLKALEEAERANKAKSEFLSRMSHELRTPMNSILGFAQLMALGELPPKQRTSVDHIINSGKHLLHLINEVLDISKIESGKFHLSIEPVQLIPLIPEILDLLEPTAASSHLTLSLEQSPSNEFFVLSDIQRLKQILINIISNAIKYNRPNGTVTIRTALKTDGGNSQAMVRISVSDTGPGIKPENINKLFQPFERIGAEKTAMEGTGLGLQIVQKLVQAMKGNVGVDSVIGTGSTFWFELPLAKEGEKIGKGEFTTIPFLRTKGVEASGTLLYVEDNMSNYELVEDILKTHRPSVRLLSTIYGNSAVPLAVEHKPGLILLDLDLPDIHGSEVLKQLLENEFTKEIPVIIVSADAMAWQIKKLLDAGARDFLIKPLDVKVFLKVVDDWLGNTGYL